MEQLLTPYQLSAGWGKSLPWIYKGIREGKIPFVRIGRSVRFKPSELETWLAERENIKLEMPRRITSKTPE